MSRIANYPVIVPDKVEVTLGHDEISVKGPLGVGGEVLCIVA